jgi:PAS domain S-box-containing protein
VALDKDPTNVGTGGSPLADDLTRAILETVLDAIVTIDRSGIIQSFNPAAERLFGYSAEETIGHNVSMLMPEPHTSQHDGYLKRYVGGGEPRIIGIGREVEGRHKDGSHFPLSLAVSQAECREQRIFVGVMRDLSAQRRAERQRDRFFSTTPDLICTIGSDGYFKLLNPAWEKRLGYSQRELTARPAQSFLHPDDPPLAHMGSDSAPQPARPFIESRIRTKDGGYRWMEWIIVPEEEGILLAAARDVTERKEVDRLKSEFVSIVSHELRTPLTSIRGSLGLLEHGSVVASQAQHDELVRIARENTDRLIRLINDVLDLEKIESGKLELQTSICSAEALLQEALSNVAQVANERQISIVQQVESALQVVADHDRAIQVAVNLLGNALKFSPEGSTVTLRASSANGNVRFAIRDQGPGISPEQRERLFNRFEQLDTSDRRTKGGSGLGLAIAKAIVEQHHGTIGVDALDSGGSEFYFTLPSARPPTSEHEEQSSATQHPHRVLVVEDHPDVAQVIRTTLERAGYDFAHTSTVKQATEFLSNQVVDAILLDVGLPDGSGLDLLRWVRSRDHGARDTPAVILSGQPPDTSVSPALAGGPVSWLKKPCPGSEILRAVRRAVRQPGRDPHVLIVDDDSATRRVVTELVQRLGARCLSASDGGEALRLIRQASPDLLVLDVGIGGLDGFELVERLRQGRARTTPLIVYTSRDLSAIERQALTLGTTQHLVKSRTTDEQLVGAVKNLLEGLLPRHAESSERK